MLIRKVTIAFSPHSNPSEHLIMLSEKTIFSIAFGIYLHYLSHTYLSIIYLTSISIYHLYLPIIYH